MKKMKWFIFCLIIIAIVGIVFVITKSNDGSLTQSKVVKSFSAPEKEGDNEEIDLSTKASDENEAREIAQYYGIIYIDYYRGYGFYKSNKSYEELKQIGEENNYPELEILYKSYTN